MAQVFGLSPEGFKAKTLNHIKSELEAELLAKVDPTLVFDADTIAGTITAIVANQACQVWESLSGLYHSLQPETATGRALDALCSLSGTYRKKAAYSKVSAVVTLDAKAKVPKDTRLQNIVGHFFNMTKEVSNTTNARTELGIDLIAEETGRIVAHKDTEAKIMTPVAGLSKAIFKETREIGRFTETDDELRLRRIVELKANGATTVDAIRSRLKQLDHVDSVYLKEGPRSFEAVVKGGDDQDIANTIWQCKPIGVETTGMVERTVTDSIDVARKIRFSRPTEIPLKLHANLKVKRRLEAGELNTLKNALVENSKKHFALGAEVYGSRFFATFLNDPLVLDIMTLQLRDRASGNAAPTEIKPEQIASLAFNDIIIEQVVESAP
ncbi:hypothetical protein E6Q11_06260 [Candidatus Dojkabacteria bacterium]|uniref:Uncharacterized protein n=1 Tax=Candidatus Dojkabacteria bacterium TaxID=2099670 RepID=A0A5C7J309_9BACT|nr:MAG: hypothetical protein E6Q11_06260 [Candidatus Dojkabacteria bacterium]